MQFDQQISQQNQGIPQQQGIPFQQMLNQQQGMPQQQAFMPQSGLQYNMPQYNAMQQPQQMGQQFMGQQQSQYGAQNMPQPPNVISTKDHLYLKDSMSWTLTAAKKFNMYALQCQDPEIKAHFEQIGQIHQRHYNILLSHTENSNNP